MDESVSKVPSESQTNCCGGSSDCPVDELNEEFDDNAIITLTPKGCFFGALNDANLISGGEASLFSVDRDDIEAAYKMFERLMESSGYIHRGDSPQTHIMQKDPRPTPEELFGLALKANLLSYNDAKVDAAWIFFVNNMRRVDLVV